MREPGARRILRVENLAVHFALTKGLLFRRQAATVKAVDGVSFALRRGETLGLVGESGCGKSTTGLAILRMVEPTAGRIVFEGEDITRHGKDRMRADPPAHADGLSGPLRLAQPAHDGARHHRRAAGGARSSRGDREAYRARVDELIRLVGLLPDMAERYPHEFSGGQRQRIGIARALALNPSLIICDEPVSALDVSIQAQVVNLFMELQERLRLTYIFIAHNLAVVRHISDRIAVMYLGRIVEIAHRDELYRRPLHPYTEALLAAIPVADPEVEARRPHAIVRGEVPSALNPPSGCRFHPRCPKAIDKCKTEDPALVDLGAAARSRAICIRSPGWRQRVHARLRRAMRSERKAGVQR